MIVYYGLKLENKGKKRTEEMAKKSLWRRIFKTRSEREIKRIEPIAQKIEDLEPTMQAKSDEELRDMTRQFKERLAGGETLDDILPEAFAAAREAGVRTLHQRAFHVQLLGAIVLSQGRISEIRSYQFYAYHMTMHFSESIR